MHGKDLVAALDAPREDREHVLALVGVFAAEHVAAQWYEGLRDTSKHEGEGEVSCVGPGQGDGAVRTSTALERVTH